MTIKDWAETVAAVWPVLAGLVLALVGWLIGNDRAKRVQAAHSSAIDKLILDLNKVGARVNDLKTETGLAKQRCDRAKEDHEKLEAEYRVSQKELPEREKNLRHEVVNTLNVAIQAVDDRVDELRDDVRDLKRQ